MGSAKTPLRVVGIVLGCVGMLACVAALVGEWIVQARVQEGTERLFGAADHALATVRERVVQTQQRVAAAAISTQEIEATLRDWSRREVGQRLAVRLDAANKTQRLAATLEQADAWLEVTQSSVGLVKQLLSSGIVSGAPSGTRLDELLQDVAALRTQLGEATQVVSNIQERITALTDDEADGGRLEEAINLALRVVATISSIDSRLGQLAERLSAAQSELQEVQARTWRWILLVTVVVALLILWMAAGQIALCRVAWAGGSSPRES